MGFFSSNLCVDQKQMPVRRGHKSSMSTYINSVHLQRCGVKEDSTGGVGSGIPRMFSCARRG